MKRTKEILNFLNVKRIIIFLMLRNLNLMLLNQKKSLLTLKKIILKKDYQNIYNIDKKFK